MTRTANPRAPIIEAVLPEPRQPIPVPHKSQAEQTEDQTDASRAVDPDAPGGSLFDEDDDAVEPNEPA